MPSSESHSSIQRGGRTERAIQKGGRCRAHGKWQAKAGGGGGQGSRSQGGAAATTGGVKAQPREAETQTSGGASDTEQQGEAEQAWEGGAMGGANNRGQQCVQVCHVMKELRSVKPETADMYENHPWCEALCDGVRIHAVRDLCSVKPKNCGYAWSLPMI